MLDATVLGVACQCSEFREDGRKEILKRLCWSFGCGTAAADSCRQREDCSSFSEANLFGARSRRRH